MIYGKISNTFELLTEETAIKWRVAPGTLAKVASTATAAGFTTRPALAGTPVVISSGNLTYPVTGTSALAKGVLFDNYCTDIDDSQGSGFVTVIFGTHVGKTNQVTGVTSSTAAGTPLYVTADSSDADTGKLKASGTGVAVAYVLSSDGTYTTYLWVGGHQA